MAPPGVQHAYYLAKLAQQLAYQVMPFLLLSYLQINSSAI